jgi:hypothetical protein
MPGDLIRPDDLRRITDEVEMARAREAFEKKSRIDHGSSTALGDRIMLRLVPMRCARVRVCLDLVQRRSAPT